MCECECHVDAELAERRRLVAEAMTMTPEQIRERLRAWNASLPEPNPICPRCDRIFVRDEGGSILSTWCVSCEVELIEEVMRAVAAAEGRRERRKALAGVLRVARMAS